MGFVYLAIIRCVFYINTAKKNSRFINFDFPKKIIDAVVSLNQPVSGTKSRFHDPLATIPNII
jgi:hypothetical protein